MNPKLEFQKEAIERFCREHAVRELAIFGSALREDFGPESDVDLLIHFAPEARVGLIDLQRMRDELAKIFGRPIDLITPDGLNKNIRQEVLRTSKTIHAR
jgi:predicted nucleotidyltransferase